MSVRHNEALVTFFLRGRRDDPLLSFEPVPHGEARRLRMIEENGGEVPRIDNYASWRCERAHRDPVFDDPAMDEEWYERARRGELGRMGPEEPNKAEPGSEEEDEGPVGGGSK